MPTFTSAYTAGDTVYIFFDDGSAGSCQVTEIGFREGYDPNAFVPATDFIYTLNKEERDGSTLITRTQQFCFSTKNTMSTYVLSLP